MPSGQSIDSQDDPTLRASVLSRWPDGSASVAVLSGETPVTAGTVKSIRLRASAASGTPLTAVRVGQLTTAIAFNFGGAGSATLSSFDSPEKIWWTNPQVICCRYRVPIGAGALEAVIDVHAFVSNRAFVEVVIENCKLNSAAPSAPASQSYSGATIVVNGATIATVSSNAGPNGSHQAFRAWYASTWIGGDPGIEVTHDTASIQAHPMMQRLWKTSDQNLQSLYQNDVYEPWSTERLNVPGMGAAGDSAAIGSFTQWDTRYLQSGSKYARRASLASALAALTCNINVRDSTGGGVPTFTQIGNRNIQQGTWPDSGSSGEPAWEHAHSPAVGLMAFLGRPSPVFIEIAQKAAVWQSTYGNAGNGTLRGSYQVRGKAWTLRAWNHALFITPDAEAWKVPCRTKIYNGLIDGIEPFKNLPSNKLGIGWRYDAPNFASYESTGDAANTPGGSDGLWQWHFCIVELHKIAATKALLGAQHVKAVEIADWAAAGPIRNVNESSAGEWRLQAYTFKHSRSQTAIDPMDTWGQQYQWAYGSPPPDSGGWIQNSTGTAWQVPTLGVSYDAQNWSVICIAVERGVPGADAAWAKVNSNLTNLATWANGFAAEPRWGFYPRNK